MSYIQQKYISQVSSRLRNFTYSGKNYNFSCPICGDSKKNIKKARAWFYYNPEGYSFKCYNCNAPISFYGIIKHIDEELFKQLIIEEKIGSLDSTIKIVENTVETVKIDDFSTENMLENVTSINELDNTHPAVKYVTKRRIPKIKWDKIYFSPKYMKWCNEVKPFTWSQDSLKYDHPRLVFPYFDKNGKAFGFSGRAFGDEQPKYHIVKIYPDHDKIYGLDNINKLQTIYVTEGQIDSLFLPNAIAVSGSAFNSKFIKENKDNIVIIYDNEPRSREIMNQLEKVIDDGYKVFIWPQEIKQKDINDLIMSGWTEDNVLKMIESNIFEGMVALLKYKEWRKIK